MKESRLNYLFQNYLAKTLTAIELEEFKAIAIDPAYENKFSALMDQHWEQFQFDTLPDVPGLIDQKVYNYVIQHTNTNKETAKLWPRVAVAASIAIVLSIGSYFYFNVNKIDTNQTVVYTNDIAPGKHGATLTLANGKKIRLSDAPSGELAEQTGVTVTKAANGQLVYEIKAANSIKATPGAINTLSTTKGETYEVYLPDGSVVYLNAASSLTYAVSLNERGNRMVKLVGEAYFQVAKDAKHPFIVKSGRQQVEVLGTKFNVNAYSDEAVIRTTLLEGSVKLSENGDSKMLKPGNQAVNDAGKINIHEVNTNLVTAWKNNKFIFDRLRIQEIMRMISRWYDVEIIYQGAAPADTFWGSVSRFENISEVLNALEKTGNVHFKIEGRRIYVFR